MCKYLDTIIFEDNLFSDIMSNKKKQTIRINKRTYANTITAYNASNTLSCVLNVKNVRTYKYMESMNLYKYYPNITTNDYITIVDFEKETK